ncbi:MAG: hypothetical protein OEY14_17585, partial [Myxococcales bacterium]|nr:hypothetical protein [Myxococcales bacterium]
ADDECEEPARCDGGRCAEGPACEAGVGSREHGDRCARAMRAERWTEARAHCECALAAGPTPRGEGAIRYNLGRVAEGLGDRPPPAATTA